jgi:uncharacterized MAPEG superfamily protein
MMTVMLSYSGTLAACTVLAALVLIQVLVTDFAGLRARHMPGAPIKADHADFHFRAHRAHANTNENLPVFVLLVLLALLLRVNQPWAAGAAWAFVGARALHMAFYYADLRTARSVAFGMGLIAQLVLLGVILARVLRAG